MRNGTKLFFNLLKKYTNMIIRKWKKLHVINLIQSKWNNFLTISHCNLKKYMVSNKYEDYAYHVCHHIKVLTCSNIYAKPCFKYVETQIFKFWHIFAHNSRKLKIFSFWEFRTHVCHAKAASTSFIPNIPALLRKKIRLTNYFIKND